MVLEYKFEYVSNNNNYISLLNNILRTSGSTYKICKENDFLLLYIEDQEDKLLEISNDLSQKLPMSIFLKNFTLEVVPQIPEKDYIYNLDKINLTYCSNCVANIENVYSSNIGNLFFKCDICGATCDVSNLQVKDRFEEIKYSNQKTMFQDIALKIFDNKKIRIRTNNYDFIFYKMNKLESNNQNIVCTNLESLSKLVVSSEEKKIALSSLEKPTIRFNINEIFKKNHYISFEQINVSLPKDMILYILSIELKALGVDFLSYDESKSFDFELIDEKMNCSNELFISIHNDKTFILKNTFYDKRLNEIYRKFNDDAKSQFMVLLDENKAYKKSILNLYCSTRNDEEINLYSEQIDGIIDILKYKMPLSISGILNEISKDESGKRLLENYRDKFPKVFENCIKERELYFDNSSISSLWKIVSIVLGFEKSVLENAKSALLQKGPRVDYKLIDSAKVYNREFNIIKLIQSGISFKLAGVDEKSLALGYVESYAYFLANIVDDVNKEFPLDGVALSGNLIADEFFYKMLTKAITKNFKLFYNKDFPIQL